MGIIDNGTFILAIVPRHVDSVELIRNQFSMVTDAVGGAGLFCGYFRTFSSKGLRFDSTA